MNHFYTIYEFIKKNNNFNNLNNSYFDRIINYFNSTNKNDDWIIMFYDF